MDRDEARLVSPRTRPSWGSVCATLLAVASALAPHPCVAAWQTFGKSVGFPQVWIEDVYEDRNETLWFVRIDGVSSYDGVQWMHYGIGGLIRGFADAPGGSIWAATTGGLFELQGARWVRYAIPGLPIDARLTCAHTTRSGAVWLGVDAAGSFQGAMRYDGAAWTAFTSANGLGSNLVNSIFEDLAGGVWFACSPAAGQSGGATRLSGSVARTFGTLDGLPSADVFEVDEGAGGNLWALTAAGLARFDGSGFLPLNGVPGTPTSFDAGATLLVERNGNIWVGGHLAGGPRRFDGVTWRSFTTADGLFYDEDVFDIFQDRAGNIWFATRYGVARFDGEEWKVFTDADGLPSREIKSFLLDRSGGFWIGTFGPGAARFDGVDWTTYTTANGLAGSRVNAMLEDRSGAIWFACNNGVSRLVGTTFTSYDTTSGLPPPPSYSTFSEYLCLAEDAAGRIWVGSENGAARFEGATWTQFTDSLPSLVVNDIHVDRLDRVWLATDAGLTRYDATGPRIFRAADGLGYDRVTSIAEDSLGNLWFATPEYDIGGVTRYDGTTWTRFSTADGLQSAGAKTVFVDHLGRVWVGSDTRGLPGPQRGGASRLDGDHWRNYATDDGLPVGDVRAIGEDAKGNIWLATHTSGGAVDGPVRLSPDLVPTQTVLILRPPAVWPVGTVSVAAAAAFGEGEGVEFSFRVDGGPWAPWSPIGSWEAAGLPDGIHVIESKSRDRERNVDQTPAKTLFEVDATPPSPRVASPGSGDIVRETIAIVGSTEDLRYKTTAVGVRLAGDPGPATTPPGATITPGPVTEGQIATWNTRLVPDGIYDLDVVVGDSLGLFGRTSVRVTVDNAYPPAAVTAPATVIAAEGGDVYTTSADLHLYFAPRSFRADTRVDIRALPADSIPASLPGGATSAGMGFHVSWQGQELQKPARADQRLAFLTLPPGIPAFYYSESGAAWSRLGGTVSDGSLQSSFSSPGYYALFVDGGGAVAPGTASGLAFTPRVFSPTGGYADREVGISFSLPRPASTTVRVFNRSGRLVREVLSSQMLSAGANMVRWDGRDVDGKDVLDGIYFVTVETLGATLKEALAVVR